MCAGKKKQLAIIKGFRYHTVLTVDGPSTAVFGLAAFCGFIIMIIIIKIKK